MTRRPQQGLLVFGLAIWLSAHAQAQPPKQAPGAWDKKPGAAQAGQSSANAPPRKDAPRAAGDQDKGPAKAAGGQAAQGNPGQKASGDRNKAGQQANTPTGHSNPGKSGADGKTHEAGKSNDLGKAARPGGAAPRKQAAQQRR